MQPDDPPHGPGMQQRIRLDKNWVSTKIRGGGVSVRNQVDYNVLLLWYSWQGSACTDIATKNYAKMVFY